MITISGILSRRAVKRSASWHLVREWEDELSRLLGVPVKAPGRAGWWMLEWSRRMLAPRDWGNTAGCYKLEPVMIAAAGNRGLYGPGCLPWVIDYFLDADGTRRFIASTSQCPVVYLSSREALERVLAAGGDAARYRHLPLTLPSRYRLDPGAVIDKDIDLALVGRTSGRLAGWARRYVDARPGLRVVTGGPKRAHRHWVYDLDGRPVADVENRADYLHMLRRSRLFLYATPGLEDGKDTGGYSQVTPRLLEALAQGCAVLMRYRANADTDWYGLPGLCQSIECYDDFARAADGALALPQAAVTARNAAYLEGHYTESMAEELKQCNE